MADFELAIRDGVEVHVPFTICSRSAGASLLDRRFHQQSGFFDCGWADGHIYADQPDTRRISRRDARLQPSRFRPHITQQFDSDLGDFAFTFYLHVTPDNDRCAAFDRQRNEIKTYGPSPDYVKGFYGDRVAFSWNFKLDATFQPSPNFTHIHQIKAGDGDAAAPILALTPSESPDPQAVALSASAPQAPPCG